MTIRIIGAAGFALFVFGSGVQAATVTGTFGNTYTANQSLFGGASSSAFDISTTIGGVLNFSADANSGTVNSTSISSHSLTYENVLTLSQAAGAAFQHKVSQLRSGFTTAFGAKANANVSILGATFDIIDEGALVETSRSNVSTSFGSSVDDTGNDALVGKELSIPLISPVVAATVNLEQRSNQIIDRVTGIIRAKNNTTGTVVNRAYDINSFSTETFSLNLGEVGQWDIYAISMDMFGRFDADFGTSSTGTVGGFIGFNCGDVSTDADNGFGCVGDEGFSVTSPVAYLKNGTPFGLNYDANSSSRFIGTLNVLADPIQPGVVPLPAGAFLLLSGLGLAGGLSALRRKRMI